MTPKSIMTNRATAIKITMGIIVLYYTYIRQLYEPENGQSPFYIGYTKKPG